MHRAWREFRRPSETVRSAYESGWVPFWVYIVTNALYFNDWRENIAAILRGQQLDYPQAPGRSQVLNPCAGFAPASGVHPHVAPPRDSCQPDKAWSANYQDNASGSLLKADGTLLIASFKEGSSVVKPPQQALSPVLLIIRVNFHHRFEFLPDRIHHP